MDYETLKVSFVNRRHVWWDSLAYRDASQLGKPLGSVTERPDRFYRGA